MSDDLNIEIGLPGAKRSGTMAQLFQLDVQRAQEEFAVDRQVMPVADAVAEFTRKLRKLGFYPREIYHEIEKVMS